MERGLFGFVSVGDFLTSLFGLSSIKINTVFAILTAISAFISNYMWDTPQALYVLWLLMLCDFITGVIKSVKNKNFSSWRMPRMLVQLVATTIWSSTISIFPLDISSPKQISFHLIYLYIKDYHSLDY